MRNIVHFTGQNLWFWALSLIPLAQFFALEITSPVWVILLTPASYVVPIDFIRLPIIAAIRALAYDEAIDLMVLLGGGVIFLGIWCNIRAELGPKQHRKKVTNP